MSDSIGNLAAALAVVQGKMRSSAKGRVNPFFKSRYSTLEDVWDCARAPLSENGLAVIQLLGTTAEGAVTVTTILAHKSGESVRGDFTVPVTKKDAQAYGSAATYARRYAFAAMVGVVPSEDDDGNAATHDEKGPTERSSAASRVSSRLRAPEREPGSDDTYGDLPSAGGVTPAQMRHELAEAGKTGSEVKNAAHACGFKGRSLDSLTDDEVRRLYDSVPWPKTGGAS